MLQLRGFTVWLMVVRTLKQTTAACSSVAFTGLTFAFRAAWAGCRWGSSLVGSVYVASATSRDLSPRGSVPARLYPLSSSGAVRIAAAAAPQQEQQHHH
jgi:hypothetical protein